MLIPALPIKKKTKIQVIKNTNRKPAILHILPNAPQSCYQKLIPKANSQNYVIEANFAHSKVHNYSRKLFTELLPKILPEICSPKLVWEVAPEQLSTTPKLVPNVVPKNIPEINFPKLSKIATKNYSAKFLVNTCPKVAVLRSK